MYNSRQHLHLRFRRRFLGICAFMKSDTPQKSTAKAEENG
jgi:hypothetical protein